MTLLCSCCYPCIFFCSNCDFADITMARRVNMISEINDNMSTLKLQVRVMSLWEVMKFNNSAEVQSLEMLLIDEEVYI